jgi:hypothetical protein
LRHRWQTFAGGLVTAAMVIIGSQFIIHRTSWFQNWPAEIATLTTTARDPDGPSSFGPPARQSEGWPPDSYVIGKGPAVADTLLWGDSHAMAILPGLRAYVDRTGQRVVVSAHPGCPPLVNVRFYGNRFVDRCKAVNDKIFSAMSNAAIRRVVLVARWMLFADGLHYDREGGAVYRWGEETAADHDFGEILEATVKALAARGKMVVIVGPIPEQPFDVMRLMARHIAWDDPLPEEQTVQHFLESEGRVLPELARLSSSGEAAVVYPHLTLCDDRVCHYQKDGRPIYLDANHLNAVGAALLDRLYSELFVSGRNAHAALHSALN